MEKSRRAPFRVVGSALAIFKAMTGQVAQKLGKFKKVSKMPTAVGQFLLLAVSLILAGNEHAQATSATIKDSRSVQALEAHAEIQSLTLEIDRFRGLTPEFKVIYDLGHAYKIGVSLVGKSATTYFQYRRWDWLRRNGYSEFAKERFDNDFTNIYRNNSDIELTIEGADSARFLADLKGIYPHLAITTRKPATGELLISLTESSSALHCAAIEDKVESKILNDLAYGILDSEFVATLNSDTLARSMSLVATASQLRMKISDEMITALKLVFHDLRRYDASSLTALGKQIESAFVSAVDIEFTAQLFEVLGLKNEYLKLPLPHQDSDLIVHRTAINWLSKIPLETLIRSGKLETNVEYRDLIFAHQTMNYRALTNDPTNRVNAFVTTDGRNGSKNAGGHWGFYAAYGPNSYSGGWLPTVRFKVIGGVRGTDYLSILVESTHQFFNKEVIRIIPESPFSSSLEYFSYLNSLGDAFPDGAKEFVNERRLINQVNLLSESERSQLLMLINKGITRELLHVEDHRYWHVTSAVLRTQLASQHTDLLLKHWGRSRKLNGRLLYFLDQFNWLTEESVLSLLSRTTFTDRELLHLVNYKSWQGNADKLEMVLRTQSPSALRFARSELLSYQPRQNKLAIDVIRKIRRNLAPSSCESLFQN